MGKKSKSTSTQEMRPSKHVEPYLKDFLSAGSDLFEAGPSSYYPGQTYVDTTAGTQFAMDHLSGLTGGGMPDYHGAATDHLGNVLSGGHFDDRSAELEKAISRATRQVTPGLNHAWASGGGVGATSSPLFADAAATATGYVIGDYMDNYERRQESRQDAALSMVPTYLSLETLPAQWGSQLGAMQEVEAMKPLTDDINRYNYDQNAEWDNLQRWGSQLGSIAPLMGGTNISTQTKPGGGFLSSALGIASMAMPFLGPAAGIAGSAGGMMGSMGPMSTMMGLGNMGLGNHNGYPVGGMLSPWGMGSTVPWT